MNLKRNDEYAKTSLKRIIGISLVFVFVLGIGVLAGNTKLNSINIKFANNHETTVLTSKTKVSEILEENHIVLASNEVVSPPLDSEITDSKTIKIMLAGNETMEVAKVSDGEITDVSDIKQKYENLTEKIVTVEEEIPFETIKKDVSNGNGSKANMIIQYGKKGLKEITYKITYQDGKEIDKEELESKIIKKPVNQIVQVQTRLSVTSRSGVRTGGVTTASSGRYVITAYCACMKCCR
jgi:uncharacterized protein YabE (DUF348 family)